MKRQIRNRDPMMRGESERQKKVRRRRKLYRQQGGLCFWCKVEMALPPENEHVKNPPSTMATIEHLRDRFHPHRADGNPKREQRWVLACLACNHQRGRVRQAALVDVQRAKSILGHADKAMRRIAAENTESVVKTK